ncbi:MAG: hypothetical protein A3B68_01755 [Candidatus Melainabacteria bacterium RIFCSPHIGHO2_02_FULL_34_12]|nr:MAG: hypothetical protein A3B68_01755 [Candidatus Melainabacteria bacterium RIFCSPHIGHO2_02_FULL_34_12]
MIKRFNENHFAREFDLVIIGAGINGCGIARDASERGLKVLLIEKNDFGSGCTAASTRLIHGGLRYLEHFEFDLVRESLVEREILLKNANHLVKPIRLCIPVYEGDKRGYWLIKSGMVLYDLLSFDKTLPSHKMLDSEGFLKYEPSLNSNLLKGGAVYYDAQVAFPERICLENALMAKLNGAMVLNHAEVKSIKIIEDKISSLEIIDKLCGEKYIVKGKIILNIAGPWVDKLCNLTGRDIKKQIGGTKGSHIIIEKFQNGPTHAIYTSAKLDGRPFFIIPWQEYYLIGTTDILFTNDLEHLKATNEEINYLLNEANRILKTKQITKADILYSYAGVRPLSLPSLQSNDPAGITRKHIIHDHKGDGISNFISVIGGKLTTYRHLSEEAVNLVYKKLNCNFVKSKTKFIPFMGNFEQGKNNETYFKSLINRAQKKYDLDPEIITHLINLYGKRYKLVLDLTLKDKDLGRLISSHSLDIRAQILFSLHNEIAFTVSDILLRRTTLGFNKTIGEDSINEAAKFIQESYFVSPDEMKKQIADYYENVIKLRKVSV